MLTGVSLEVKSSSDGLYQALNLNPGTYSVKVVVTGFQTLLRENLILQGGQQLRVDAQLTVGSVSQTIEVTEASSQLNTENSTTTLGPITSHNTVTLPNLSGVPTWPDPYNQLLVGSADVPLLQ